MRYNRQQRPYEQQPYPLYERNIRPYFHPPQQPIKNLAVRGISGLNKTLNNVQNIVNVVEKAAPVIEKYGPLMKNIPAMYKVLKTMQTSDSQEKQAVESEQKLSQKKDFKTTTEDQSTDRLKQTGISRPKLFINE